MAHYAIFDPRLYLSKRLLRVYSLHAGGYVEVLDPSKLENLDLGLCLWKGTFEGMTGTWLRWQDSQGNLLLTGAEHAEQERERAEQERARAAQERERAEQAERLAEKQAEENAILREKLRQLGFDPDQK